MTAATGNIVTLATGEAVDSASPEWRAECFARWQRCVEMRSMDQYGRRQVIAKVRMDDGDVAAQRLSDAYASDWADRRAKKTGATS